MAARGVQAGTPTTRNVFYNLLCPPRPHTVQLRGLSIAIGRLAAVCC